MRCFGLSLQYLALIISSSLISKDGFFKDTDLSKTNKPAFFKEKSLSLATLSEHSCNCWTVDGTMWRHVSDLQNNTGRIFSWYNAHFRGMTNNLKDVSSGNKDLTIRGRRQQWRCHLSLTYNCACSCCHIAVACSGRERQWMSFGIVRKRDSCAVSVCRKKVKTTAFLPKKGQRTEVIWHFTHISFYLYLNKRNLVRIGEWFRYILLSNSWVMITRG